IPSVRSVTIGVWILTGSRNEGYTNNGISHLIEHMMFKGTEKRTARDIAEAFDSIGGQVNAFTSKEYTCYFARVMDTYKEHAPDDIVHDLLAKAAYGEHSLGYPILGTDKHLNSFTREDLFAYKDTFYNPSNVVISVAGNVDTEFITKVEDYFNQFENESKPNK